jgi:hypothetical protein
MDQIVQWEYGEAWRIIAALLVEEKAVFGYDLYNEPHPGRIPWHEFAPILNDFYTTLIQTVRSVDSVHAVLFEPVLGTPILGEHIALKPSGEKLVFSPHVYLRGSENYLDQTISRLVDISINRWSIPVWIGEFGGVAVDLNQEASLGNLNNTLSLFARYRLGWAYWRMQKTESGPQLVDAQGQNSRDLTSIITTWIDAEANEVPIPEFDSSLHSPAILLAVAFSLIAFRTLRSARDRGKFQAAP